MIADSDKSNQENEDIKKEICKVFTDNNLHLKAEANKKVTDFLDVTLNLNTGEYSPYHKPNNIPVYVNAGSNHPPKVLKNIALGVQKRLSTNSSSKEIFDEAKPMYQDALKKAGHKHNLEYEKIDVSTLNKKKRKRKRYKRIFYFTPPFEMTVATNIGKEFIGLVKEEFPPGHPYHSVLNEHTVKFSYSVLPSLMKKINHHNAKIAKEEQNPIIDDYDPEDETDYDQIEVIPETVLVARGPVVPPPPAEPEPALARPCEDCEDDCGGLVVEPAPPQLPPTAPAPPPPPPPSRCY